MFINYGWNAAHVKTVPSKNSTCEQCKKFGFINIYAYWYHVFLYWIPMFPYKRAVISKCENCGAENEYVHSPGLEREIKQVKKSAKPKFWQFSGVIIIASIILYFQISAANERKQNESFILNPMEGDVYKTEFAPGEYSTMKVIGTNEDSVFVIYNNYATSRQDQTKNLNTKENYSDEVYYFLKPDLKKHFNKGEIFDVTRF